MLAQALAEMVATLLISFQALDYPPYYYYFVKALKPTLMRPQGMGYSEEAEQILARLKK